MCAKYKHVKFRVTLWEASASLLLVGNIMQDITNLQQQAVAVIEQAQDVSILEAIRVEYLGKKGKLTEILKNLVNLSAEDSSLIKPSATSVHASKLKCSN